MSALRPLTILCLASEVKGHEFLRECKRQGCRVLLVTRQKHADADWPREAIDEIFFLTTLWERDDLLKGISYLARSQAIDRIVPLDDYDVEGAAILREHLRIPGMGDTTARYFRDKLAMRVKARDHGIPVPEFVPVINYDRIRAYMERVSPPWLLKPRSEAASFGIKKVLAPDELWKMLDALGDRQSFYVLEQYVPGKVYHVDAIVSEREVVFAVAHRYGHSPMEVTYSGGISSTRTLPRASAEGQALTWLNREVIDTLGLVRGATHTEFIRGREDGRFYFLEAAARVGGAYTADVVEAATGIDLWAEWAKIEVAGGERPYVLPPHREDYAGLIISLARQEWPDTSAYTDPEIVQRLSKQYHAGLIVASPDQARVESLLDAYSERFAQDFFATAPPKTAR